MTTAMRSSCAISIHALREEGDSIGCRCGATISLISIHALREEGDRGDAEAHRRVARFLSTPSARRATSGP